MLMGARRWALSNIAKNETRLIVGVSGQLLSFFHASMNDAVGQSEVL